MWLLVQWLNPANHQASVTEIAVYVMLGLNAVASRHQLALLTVKTVVNVCLLSTPVSPHSLLTRLQSGTLSLLTRYIPARRVNTVWRCLEAISAALASTHFLGGLAAAIPNAVEHVKRQRLEEIRAEERKSEMLQERNYSLIVSTIYSIPREGMQLTDINCVQH